MLCQQMPLQSQGHSGVRPLKTGNVSTGKNAFTED